MTDEISEPHPFKAALFARFKSGLGQVFDEYDDPKSQDKKMIGYRLAVSPNFRRGNLQDYLCIHAYDLQRQPVREDVIAIVVTYDQLKLEYRPVQQAPLPAPTTPQRRTLRSRLFPPKT